MNLGFSKQTGFTLIELLFAIFIFTIVISSVYGAYNATFHIIHSSEAYLNESHKARAALERISEDLTAFITGPGAFLLGTEQEISGGRGDSISFLSSTHISLRENDIFQGDTLIRYSSQADETDGTIRLMRSDTMRLPGTTTETEDETKFLLCSGLKEVRFTYYNEDGQETTEWETESEVQEDGTETSPELPVMISIELVFPGQDADTNGSNFKTAVALLRDFEE